VIANERCLTHIGIWQQEQMKKMGRVTLLPDEYKNLREKISEIRHNTKRPCTEATKIKISESNKINHNNYDLTKRKTIVS
jgi:hypothetical protein